MRALRLAPRLLMLLSIVLVLLGGLGAGLSRLGWSMGAASQNWMLIHGPLMICGFLGTLLTLERAVALASRARWSIIAPAVNALGAIVLLLEPEAAAARLLLTLGSLGLVGMFVLMLRLHPSRDIVIMALGALCWLIGNSLWLSGQPVFAVVHLWVAFLILTIVGERLELSRVRHLTRTSERLLTLAVGVYLAGVLLTIFNLDLGVRLLGAGAVFMAAWLLHYDVARRTIRQTGLTRYIGACLLAGYGWLGFGGLLAIGYGAIYAGPPYAAVLHSFLLGFVFSMIFGHAPIIVPALTGLYLNYAPTFYVPLILLQITLIYRMVGILAVDNTAQQWGGMLNAVVILLFLAGLIFTLFRSNVGRPAEAASG